MATPIPPTITLLPLHEVAVPGNHAAWLTEAERGRLAAMTAPLRRDQYLAGHWLARQAASAWLGGEPQEWEWRPDGPRPALARRSHGHACQLSIAHCGHWVAVAVAGEPIGLDIESGRAGDDWTGRARRLLSLPEAATVAAAPDPRQAFLRFWTLKEAEGKRAGTGLLPKRARRFQAILASPTEAEAWCWERDGLSVALATAPGAPAPLGLGPYLEAFRFRSLGTDEA